MFYYFCFIIFLELVGHNNYLSMPDIVRFIRELEQAGARTDHISGNLQENEFPLFFSLFLSVQRKDGDLNLNIIMLDRTHNATKLELFPSNIAFRGCIRSFLTDVSLYPND